LIGAENTSRLIQIQDVHLTIIVPQPSPDSVYNDISYSQVLKQRRPLLRLCTVLYNWSWRQRSHCAPDTPWAT